MTDGAHSNAPGSASATASTTEAESGALVGRAFGNYIVDRLLAAGGMGEVYLLRHGTLPGTWRVLKVILPSLSANEFVRGRFEREAYAVAALGAHDNIVGIDDFGSMEDGQLWMIMPYVSGKPLDAHLTENGGRLPPYRVLELLLPIALGVAHAHACGIVHRDLKPSNVFLTTTSNGAPTCKVLDFGIARQRNASPHLPSTTQHFAMGTPSYMAVEQYENAADADVTADVYALGCMIWEMVTGAPPWPAQDPAVLYHKKLHEPPGPPLGNTMPSGWEKTLRACVAVEPAKRPQSVRALIQALAADLPGSPPFVPSGLDLLHRLAPRLEEREPDDRTLRKPGAEPTTSSSASTPIATERTTLGSSNGVVTAPSRPARWKLAGLGAAAIIVATLGTYAATIVRRGGGAEHDAVPMEALPAAAPKPTPTAVRAPSNEASPAVAPLPSAPRLPATATAPVAASPTAPTTTNPTTVTPAAPTTIVRTPATPDAPASRVAAPTQPAQLTTTAPSKPTNAASSSTQPAPAAPPAGLPKAPATRTKTSATSGNARTPERPQPNPSRAEPHHKFDPNAVGGQEQE